MRKQFYPHISGYLQDPRYIKTPLLTLVLFLLLAITPSCNEEDCPLLASQAILAFEEYEAVKAAGDNEALELEKCTAAREALAFYYANCEEERDELENALLSLPCQ